MNRYFVPTMFFLCFVFLGFTCDLNAQTKKTTAKVAPKTTAAVEESESSENMGMGLESRFDSGVEPMKFDRMNIVPGTPMTVKPTMDNMVSDSKGRATGGILSRYDTTNFGKFFASGSLTQPTYTDRTAKLDDLSQRDNAFQNRQTQIDRIYPPRLYSNPDELPTTDGNAPEVKTNIANAIRGIENRFELKSRGEKIFTKLENGVLTLTGNLRSSDLADTIVNVLSMEAGIDRIENKIIILEP
ncbi:MAG: hypothetical protein Q4G69_12365 [Planctomycetia bacterium]|nr:hypothetical protein [Planctomycetia bacterium]